MRKACNQAMWEALWHYSTQENPRPCAEIAYAVMQCFWDPHAVISDRPSAMWAKGRDEQPCMPCKDSWAMSTRTKNNWVTPESLFWHNQKTFLGHLTSYSLTPKDSRETHANYPRLGVSLQAVWETLLGSHKTQPKMPPRCPPKRTGHTPLVSLLPFYK